MFNVHSYIYEIIYEDVIWRLKNEHYQDRNKSVSVVFIIINHPI